MGKDSILPTTSDAQELSSALMKALRVGEDKNSKCGPGLFLQSYVHVVSSRSRSISPALDSACSVAVSCEIHVRVTGEYCMGRVQCVQVPPPTHLPCNYVNLM